MVAMARLVAKTAMPHQVEAEYSGTNLGVLALCRGHFWPMRT